MIIEKVNPIIIYPKCKELCLEQDCLHCNRKLICDSPLSKCITPYHNHPNGCPSYGKKLGCPPQLKMFDWIFDIKKDIYAIITIFDLEEHINKMRKVHQNWTNYQLRNSRYWQGTDKAEH